MRRHDLHREPALSEMLADPVIQAVMARDNVQASAIVELFRALRDRCETPALAA